MRQTLAYFCLEVVDTLKTIMGPAVGGQTLAATRAAGVSRTHLPTGGGESVGPGSGLMTGVAPVLTAVGARAGLWSCFPYVRQLSVEIKVVVTSGVARG